MCTSRSESSRRWSTASRLRPKLPSRSMQAMPKLHELAHCRAGDKVNTSVLSLIAYRAEDYPLLAAQVTIHAVAKHLRGIVEGDIRRFELPALWALQYVCARSLRGGVDRN